jgi:4-azaleucine resistance transporter AzlC
MAPLDVGVAAFGLVFGAAAVNAGLSAVEALLMSVLVFSGAAQFTGVTMLAAGANSLTIVLTTLALGLRHVLMGASIASYLRGLRVGWRALLAYFLVDESYAVAISRYRGGRGDPWFFLGAGLALFVVWTLATVAGASLGRLIPDPSMLGLDLVFPFIFLGLLAGIARTRLEIAAAVAAGVIALAGSQWLPDKWYFIVAALVATLGAAAIDRAH